MKKLGALILGAILTIGIGAGISVKPATDVAHAKETSIDFSAQSYKNGEEISSVKIGDSGITVDFNKGTNNNPPKYYTSGTAVRTYGGNYFTIHGTDVTINQIKLGFGSSDGSNAISVDVGSYTSGTWTGSSDSVTFTIGGTSGNRRIKTIAVDYTLGGTGGEEKMPVGIKAALAVQEKEWFVGDTITNEDLTVNTIDEVGGIIKKLNKDEYEISDPTIASTSHTITVTYEDFSDEITIEASEIELSDYELVDEASDLVLNSKVIIAAAGYEKAMSTEQKSNNRGTTDIKKSDTTIVAPNEKVQIFSLVEGTIEGTYAFNTGSGYIYAASSEKNYLRTQNSNDANSSFKITFSEGITSVVAQGSNTKNVLRFNLDSNLFSCYGPDSQNPVCLYVDKPEAGKVSTIELNETKVLTTLDQQLTLMATVNQDATNPTLDWSSSDETIATVSNGAVTFIKNGFVTITATSTDGSNISASCDVAITTKDGLTAETALTAEDAVVVAKYTGTTNSANKYYVAGNVTKIDTAFSAQYKNITFTIDGVFKAYRLSTTSALDVVVGDYVVANGNIVNYQNNTPEFAAGCTLISNSYSAASVAERIRTLAGGWENEVATENCYNNYAAANELVLALSETELNTFKTSTDTEIASARTTYEHWCLVNGAEAYAATVPAGSRLNAFNNQDNTLIIISIVAGLILVATAVLLINRKRKFSK